VAEARLSRRGAGQYRQGASLAPMETLPTNERGPNGPPSRRRWGWLVAAVAIVMVAIVALVAVGQTGSASGSKKSSAGGNPLTLPSLISPGQRLPDATLVRANGGHVSLDGYRGKPLVLNLWYSYCAPCRTEMPALQKLHAEFGDRAAFLGIDPVDGAATALTTAQSFGIRYDVALDPKGLVVNAIHTTVTPTTVVVGPTGIVSWVHIGAVKSNDLRSAINQALH
jgi:cytochrome c biogenesis protein CcmG, thiol:disulfide interchange protein DsbE